MRSARSANACGPYFEVKGLRGGRPLTKAEVTREVEGPCRAEPFEQVGRARLDAGGILVQGGALVRGGRPSRGGTPARGGRPACIS